MSLWNLMRYWGRRASNQIFTKALSTQSTSFSLGTTTTSSLSNSFAISINLIKMKCFLQWSDRSRKNLHSNWRLYRNHKSWLQWRISNNCKNETLLWKFNPFFLKGNNRGILPRALDSIMQRLSDLDEECQLMISFYEVYNEKVLYASCYLWRD